MVGAPERDVEFDLRVSGSGMETIRETVTTEDLADLGPFEVPARTDISFSLTARDDVYSGGTVERFGPGAEGSVEIPIYPGPVFVDDDSNTLYQVRDLSVDLVDDEGGAVRSFTGADLNVSGNIVDAEYGPEGLLWVLTDDDTTQTVYAFDSLGENPVASVGSITGGITGGETIAVSSDYVYVKDGPQSVWRGTIARSGDEVTNVTDGNTGFDFIPAAIDTATVNAFGNIDQLALDSEFGQGFAVIQDISAREDGTLYITYRTSYDGSFEDDPDTYDPETETSKLYFEVEYNERILEAVEDALGADQLGSVLRNAVDDLYSEADEDLIAFLEVVDTINFSEVRAIFQQIASLETDIFEEIDSTETTGSETSEDLIADLPDDFATLVLQFADIVEGFLIEYETLDSVQEAPTPEDRREQAEFTAFGLSSFVYFVANIEEFEEEVEGQPVEFDIEFDDIITLVEFVDSLDGSLPDADSLVDLAFADFELGDELIDEVLVELESALEESDLKDNLDYFGLRFLATVGIDSQGAISEGPAIHGPIVDEGPVVGTLRGVGNSVYVGQSTIEPEIVTAMRAYRDNAVTAVANALSAQETQDDPFNLEGALADAIEELLNRALSTVPEEVLNNTEYLRTEGMLRYSPGLVPQGSWGSIDPAPDQASTQRGEFWGPRRFGTSRDNRLILIDEWLDDGRLLRFNFGSNSGWQVNEAGELQFFPLTIPG